MEKKEFVQKLIISIANNPNWTPPKTQEELDEIVGWMENIYDTIEKS